jgi:hypothetical protein
MDVLLLIFLIGYAAIALTMLATTIVLIMITKTVHKNGAPKPENDPDHRAWSASKE